MLIIDQPAIHRALTTLLNPEHGRIVEAFQEVREVLDVGDEDLKAYALGAPVPPSVASTLCAAMGASPTQFVCVADGFMIVDQKLPGQLESANNDNATLRGNLTTAMDQVERFAGLAGDREAEKNQLFAQLTMEKKQREAFEKQAEVLEKVIKDNEALIKAQADRIRELGEVPWYKRMLGWA